MLLRPRFARAGVTQLTSSRGFRCPMTVPSSLKPATSIPANAVSRKMSSSPDWNTIKAVVFDAYGTLFNVNSAASAMKDDIGQNWQQLSELWRQKQLSYTWLRSLMPEYVDFEELTSKALDHALETYKLHEKPDLKKKLMDLYMKLEAYPEVPLTLASLRSKGLQTAILSNGSPKMLNAAVNSAGIKHLLDAVLSVDTVQVFKPFPTVYVVLERPGISDLFISNFLSFLSVPSFQIRPRAGPFLSPQRRNPLCLVQLLGRPRRFSLRVQGVLVQPRWPRR